MEKSKLTVDKDLEIYQDKLLELDYSQEVRKQHQHCFSLGVLKPQQTQLILECLMQIKSIQEMKQPMVDI
jgi:hypothetical protein